MKKLVSLLLVLCLLLSCAAALADEETKYPISEGSYPLVEGEPITIKLGVKRDDTRGGKPEDVWLWKYLSQLMNVKFEFTTILTSALTERKSLMFASDELPDVLIGYALTPAELVTYGQVDKQLLPLNDYLNDEYMPNMMQWIEAYPAILTAITCPDGNVYTLPHIRSALNRNTANSLSCLYINQEWLDANGKARPATLDEFTQLLRDYKAANPEYYPFAASTSYCPAVGALLNAYGFLSDRADWMGKDVTLYNGKVSIPVMEDVFQEYVKLLKTYYDEGLIRDDFFTADDTVIKAQVGENEALIFGSSPYGANPAYESFSRYEALEPLTSEYNAEPIVSNISSLRVGGFVVSAKAEHVDVIMKMADWFFSGLGGFYQWYGPAAGDTEMNLGMENVLGWEVDENGVGTFVATTSGVTANNAAYLLGNIVQDWVVFGNDSCWLGREDEGLVTMANVRQWLAGYQPDEATDMTNGHYHDCYTALEHVGPYVQDDYPSIVYMSEDDSLTVTDLRSVLDGYIEQEIAKFITGRRSLDEWASFQAELKGMGIEELLGYYEAAYTK